MSAMKIMAYGLKQRAENRNLDSEKRVIEIFKDIYNRLPDSTYDWNVMQAITYSGATSKEKEDKDDSTEGKVEEKKTEEIKEIKEKEAEKETEKR